MKPKTIIKKNEQMTLNAKKMSTIQIEQWHGLRKIKPFLGLFYVIVVSVRIEFVANDSFSVVYHLRTRRKLHWIEVWKPVNRDSSISFTSFFYYVLCYYKCWQFSDVLFFLRRERKITVITITWKTLIHRDKVDSLNSWSTYDDHVPRTFLCARLFVLLIV